MDYHASPKPLLPLQNTLRLISYYAPHRAEVVVYRRPVLFLKMYEEPNASHFTLLAIYSPTTKHGLINDA